MVGDGVNFDFEIFVDVWKKRQFNFPTQSLAVKSLMGWMV